VSSPDRAARPSWTSRSRCASVSARAKRRPARVQALAEERDGDLVRAARVRAERGGRLVEPALVVLKDLACARDRLGDGISVAGQRDSWRELDRPPEARLVVGQRVPGATPGRARPLA